MDDISETIEPAGPNYIEMTADIVSAYLSNNHVQVAHIPELIAATHAAVSGLGRGAQPAAPMPDKPTPAQIRKSITHEALISFEDGKPYKTLKRHLTRMGLSPEAYRTRHGLPKDYPLVAASYSEARSALAKSLGLGNPRRKQDEAEAAPVPATAAPSEKPTRAARPRKTKEPT